MKCILGKNTDPYFNLAAEEYLLKNFRDEFFMVWQSKPAIILGKHQNAHAEINHGFVNKNNIRIARRLTGGGTVYHDEGNLNFVFIRNGEPGKLADFKKFVAPVIGCLGKSGIQATLGNKNELLVKNKKISGNAEHIYKDRVLHHGTLLYHSNLDMLKNALTPSQGKYSDKAIQSNRATVTNISDYLRTDMPVDKFIEWFFDCIARQFQDASGYDLTGSDIRKITDLRNEKYAAWEWIYGYSPRYVFTNSKTISNRLLEIELEVGHGIIEKAGIGGTLFTKDENRLFSASLAGIRHEESEIAGCLFKIKPDTESTAVRYRNDIVSCFF